MFSIIMPVSVTTVEKQNNLIAPVSFLNFWSGSGSLELFLLTVLIIVAGAVALFFLLRRKKSRSHSFKFTLLRVAVPVMESSSDPHSPQAKNDSLEFVREKIAVMEQLYSTFSSIRPRSFWQDLAGFPYFTLEIAVPFNQEGIAFYLAVPQDQVNYVEKQIHSFFPFVSVEKVNGYNIFVPRGKVVGAYLRQSKERFLPIRTFRELESDPLNSITNSLTKLDPRKEGAAIQLVVFPSSPGKNPKATLVAREMKQGKTLKQATEKVNRPLVAFLKEAFSRQEKNDERARLAGEREQHILTQGEEKIIEVIENKARKNSFQVNLRIISSAPTQERAEEILSDVANAFDQFEAVDGNSFRKVPAKNLKEFIASFIFRVFRRSKVLILSTEELSSIFHFGVNILKAAPRIVAAKSRTASCPPDMPQEGLVLGENIFRDQKTVIRIGRDDRRRHLYTIGQTGTGKSSFLAGLIRQDIEAGEGLCVIDPHGELVGKVLSYIPKERVKDVILFDPGDVDWPIGLNLLEYNRPEQKTFVINEMIDIFDKLYNLKEVGGPMFEQYMRNAMLLVMAHPESGSTLLEISRVLADPDFRKFKLDHCADPVVVNFWTKEAEKAGGEAALANMVPYITSKLTSFIANDIMRPIIAQQKSSFNLREIMDSQKIVLMNLSKGTIGELNAYLLGMVMVGKILIAAMSRVDMPEEKRKDFYLYIDEFHNFTTDSIVSILSEARKYRLNLIIAHQFLKQLTEKIRDAVFGNVGSLASFRIGPEDAEFVAKQYEPVFNSYDLINLDNYSTYLRMIVNGQVGTPFSMKTLPTTAGDNAAAAEIRNFSRQTYGRPREEVEKEILTRLKEAEGNVESPNPVESDIGIK
ncbi:MAG: DUF87 domain-containing protein [Candidatus Moranbacteria bacterium]|nr:DUF87 domain-containing protein [Candidatus Moranbacteria bacterium]